MKLPVQESPYSLKRQNASNLIHPNVKVDTQRESVYKSVDVTLKTSFFKTNHHHIDRNQLDVMDEIASNIKKYGYANIKIDLYNDPRHTYQNNYYLAKRRVHSVKTALQKLLGGTLMKNVKVMIDPDSLLK